MWTFVSCHVFFGNFFSVFSFPHEKPPMLTTCVCLPPTQNRQGQGGISFSERRDSASDKGLPMEEVASLSCGLSKKGSKRSLKMSWHRWGKCVIIPFCLFYVSFTPVQVWGKRLVQGRTTQTFMGLISRV